MRSIEELIKAKSKMLTLMGINEAGAAIREDEVCTCKSMIRRGIELGESCHRSKRLEQLELFRPGFWMVKWLVFADGLGYKMGCYSRRHTPNLKSIISMMETGTVVFKEVEMAAEDFAFVKFEQLYADYFDPGDSFELEERLKRLQNLQWLVRTHQFDALIAMQPTVAELLLSPGTAQGGVATTRWAMERMERMQMLWRTVMNAAVLRQVHDQGCLTALYKHAFLPLQHKTKSAEAESTSQALAPNLMRECDPRALMIPLMGLVMCNQLEMIAEMDADEIIAQALALVELGVSILHVASAHKRFAVLETLVDCGVKDIDYNQRVFDSMRPLVVVLMHAGQMDLALKLIHKQFHLQAPIMETLRYRGRGPSFEWSRGDIRKTALCFAVESGRTDIIRAIKHTGSAESILSTLTNKALKLPAIEDVLALAVELGEDINSPTYTEDVVCRGGKPPLLLACDAGSLRAVKALLRLGALAHGGKKPRLLDDALITAAQHGNAEMIRELVAHGASFASESVYGPMMPTGNYVVRGDRFAFALVEAMRFNRKECVDYLLTAPELVTARSLHALNIGLVFAAYRNDTALIDRLVSMGANVNKADSASRDGNDDSGCALFVAIRGDAVEALIALQKHGAVLSFTGLSDVVEGRPLAIAVGAGSEQVMSYLLARGDTEPLAFNPQVMLKAKPAIQQLLWQHWVDVNAMGADGLRPLHHAASSCNPVAVQSLLDCGADINGLSSTGQTPLIAYLLCMQQMHNRGRRGRFEMIGVGRDVKQVITRLLQAGADVHVTDKSGKAALDYASNDWIKKTLVEAGAEAKPEHGDRHAMAQCLWRRRRGLVAMRAARRLGEAEARSLPEDLRCV